MTPQPRFEASTAAPRISYLDLLHGIGGLTVASVDAAPVLRNLPIVASRTLESPTPAYVALLGTDVQSTGFNPAKGLPGQAIGKGKMKVRAI